MADIKITNLPLGTDIADDDELLYIDVSDTTAGPDGTDKRILIGTARTALETSNLKESRQNREAIEAVYKSQGYNNVFFFEDGFTYTESNDVGIYEDGTAWTYADAGALPVTIAAGTVPTEGVYSLTQDLDVVSDVTELTGLVLGDWHLGKKINTLGFDLSQQPGYAATSGGALGGATYTIRSLSDANNAGLTYWTSGDFIGHYAFKVGNYVAVLEGTFVNVSQLGGLPVTGSVTSNSYDSVEAFKSAIGRFDEVEAVGDFYLSETLNFKRQVYLRGVQSAGSGSGVTKKCRLFFEDDCCGVIIHRADTNASNKGVPFIEAGTSMADGSVLDSIELRMVTPPDTSDPTEIKGLHGLWLKARAELRNVSTYYWRGNGFHQVASGTSSDPYLRGNANSVAVEKVLSFYNAGNGHYVDGLDVNACKYEQMNCYLNGLHGSHDNALIGNTYVACNFGINGKQADLDTYPDLLNSAPTSKSVYLNQYLESGSVARGAGRSMLVGGMIEPNAVVTGMSYTYGSESEETRSNYAFSQIRDVSGDEIRSTVGGSSRTVFSTTAKDSVEIWRLQWDTSLENLNFRHKNLTNREAFGITGVDTQKTFGASAPVPYQLYQNNIAFGTSSGGRRMYYLFSLPTSGEFARGDIIWKVQTSAGDSMGWQCTTGGTAGSTAVFTPISNMNV